MQETIRQRAKELLKTKDVGCVLSWRKSDFEPFTEVGYFTEEADLENMIYNKYCDANLSKYLIQTTKKFKKTAVFLKPCDALSANQLIKECQFPRDAVYLIGVGCEGCIKLNDEGRELGYFETCRICTKTNHAVYDELIGAETSPRQTQDTQLRFAEVLQIEQMESDERYAFWRNQLSRCIRCNACRNICPVCNCKRCVFDNQEYDANQKTNASAFEEQMFHIIRAYHVAGRCTDCGQCSNVCPVDIDLQLLNRKFIKDINELYGVFQAGEDIDAPCPLTSFDAESD